MAGLILAHNAISLMFLPIILLYSVFLIIQATHKKYLILNSLLIIFFGFLLAAFFWVPALLEGKYTLRDIVTEGLVTDRFSSFNQFIYGPWNFGGTGYLSVQVGVIQWLAILGSIPLLYQLYRKKEKQFILYAGTFLLFWITLFLMTSSSTVVWEKITLLQKFQFPWRFLSLTVFATAVLGAFVFSRIPQKKQIVGCGIVIGSLLLLTGPYWQANGYLQKPESFYTGIYESTTDTGESSPIWSERFMEKYPKAHIEIIGGTGTITETSRSIKEHVYRSDAKTPIAVRENTVYFPGWVALVDGQEVPLQFQDNNNRGVITFSVPEGKHEVILRFTETKLRILANAVSGVSLLVLFGWGILFVTRAPKRKERKN